MSGRHAAGCFYGGPVGDEYWFIVDACPLEHEGGDGAPLIGTGDGARQAYEHLRLAGLLTTGESG